MHYVWRALLALFLLYHEIFFYLELFSDRKLCDKRTPLAFFLLYHELFSNRELFTDRELCDARILAPPHITHALHVSSSACSFSIVP